MSEDYKKIALEDVKEGQRVRIVERYPSHIATYEGVVVETDTEVNEISFGAGGYHTTVYDVRSADTGILLLEDAPKPKVVRTETVTITYYDDGTKTETLDEELFEEGISDDDLEQILEQARSDLQGIANRYGEGNK